MTTPLSIFWSSNVEEYLQFVYTDANNSSVSTTVIPPPQTEYLQSFGGNLTGPLKYFPTTLNYLPSNPLELVNRDFVDRSFDISYSLVPLAGQVSLSGNLSVPVPSNDIMVANVKYVNTLLGKYVPLSGTKLSGNINVVDSSSLSAVSRNYVDAAVESIRNFIFPAQDSVFKCTLNCCNPYTDNTVVTKKFIEAYIDSLFEQLTAAPHITLAQNIGAGAGISVLNAVFSIKCYISGQQQCGGGIGTGYPLSFQVAYQPVDAKITAGVPEIIAWNTHVYAVPCTNPSLSLTDGSKQMSVDKSFVDSKKQVFYDHIRIVQNLWTSISIDLMKLPRQPLTIMSVALDCCGPIDAMVSDFAVWSNVPSDTVTTGTAIVRYNVIDPRGTTLNNLVSLILRADILVNNESDSCPISLVVRYWSGYQSATFQRNFSINGCVGSGGTTAVTKSSWYSYSMDMTTLNPSSISDIAVIAYGESYDVGIRNLSLNVCDMDGGKAAVPGKPGVPGKDAVPAVPASPGIPEVPGTSSFPVMSATADTTVIQGTGPLLQMDLYVDALISAQDATIPLVFEINFVGTDKNAYTVRVGTGTGTSFLTANIVTLPGANTAIDLLKYAIPEPSYVTSVGIKCIGNVDTIVSKFEIHVSGDPEWTSIGGRSFKWVTGVTYSQAVAASSAYNATMFFPTNDAEDAWASQYGSQWMGLTLVAGNWTTDGTTPISYNKFVNTIDTGKPVLYSNGSMVLMDPATVLNVMLVKTSNLMSTNIVPALSTFKTDSGSGDISISSYKMSVNKTGSLEFKRSGQTVNGEIRISKNLSLVSKDFGTNQVIVQGTLKANTASTFKVGFRYVTTSGVSTSKEFPITGTNSFAPFEYALDPKDVKKITALYIDAIGPAFDYEVTLDVVGGPSSNQVVGQSNGPYSADVIVIRGLPTTDAMVSTFRADLLANNITDVNVTTIGSGVTGPTDTKTGSGAIAVMTDILTQIGNANLSLATGRKGVKKILVVSLEILPLTMTTLDSPNFVNPNGFSVGDIWCVCANSNELTACVSLQTQIATAISGFGYTLWYNVGIYTSMFTPNTGNIFYNGNTLYSKFMALPVPVVTSFLGTSSADPSYWTVEQCDGSISNNVVDKALQLTYAVASNTSFYPLVPAVPPDQGLPYVPAVPPVPAQLPILGQDPNLVCASICPDIIYYASLWEIQHNDGTVALDSTGNYVSMKYDNTLNAAVCKNLVENSDLGGNNSSWCIVKQDTGSILQTTAITSNVPTDPPSYVTRFLIEQDDPVIPDKCS